MAGFAYRALDRAGGPKSGVITAESQEAALAQLRARGLTVTELDAARPGAAESIWQRDLLAPTSLPDRKLAPMMRELATLLAARVPVDRCFDILQRTTRDKLSKRWLGAVAARLREGGAMSDAFAEAAPPVPQRHLGLIRAGEQSGALPETLTALADHLEQTEDSRRRIRGALVYPAFVLVAAFVTLLLLVTLVLPTFEGIFAGAGRSLPEPSNTILQIGKWIRGHAPQLAAGAVGLGLLLVLIARTGAGRLALSRLALLVPVIGGLRRQLDTARFCQTFAMLSANGVETLAALQSAIGAMASPALRHGARDLPGLVASGGALSAVLRGRPGFDQTAADMAEIGEETSRLPDMMAHTASLLQKQAESRAGTLVTLIAPVATIVLGGLVAVVIMSVMSAMLQLNSLV